MWDKQMSDCFVYNPNRKIRGLVSLLDQLTMLPEAILFHLHLVCHWCYLKWQEAIIVILAKAYQKILMPWMTCAILYHVQTHKKVVVSHHQVGFVFEWRLWSSIQILTALRGTVKVIRPRWCQNHDYAQSEAEGIVMVLTSPRAYNFKLYPK